MALNIDIDIDNRCGELKVGVVNSVIFMQS
jgi:hypothetical protein